MTHASESGHWYAPDGTPVYEVMGAGKMVKPDIRHARKLNLFPGVTTIIRCAAAPGLERWKVEQGIMAALTLPRADGESAESLLARIREDAEAQAKKARETGTKIHAAIQGHYEGQPPDEDLYDFVTGVVELLRQNFGEQRWVPEKPVAHPLGFGTKSDLHAPQIVLDFKGTEGDAIALAKLKTWDEHHMQLGATREALGMPKAECGIVYVSRTHPGVARLVRVDEPELKSGWAMFRSLHAYWCEKNKHWPAVQRLAA